MKSWLPDLLANVVENRLNGRLFRRKALPDGNTA
jgi:hypothetical protein